MVLRESLTAETVGLKALSFLASDDEALNRFLAISGADPATLRERAGEAQLLAAVLDFLLGDDALLIRFCEAELLDTRAVHMAAARLNG